MSRKSSSRRNQGEQQQIQRMDRMDPFTQMRQMMRGFGGFDNNDFMGGMMKLHQSDPFQNMFNFSDMHKNIHQRGQQGSYVCQSYVSSSKMGADGKIHRQDYFENNIGQNKSGNTISQKHQAYKNSGGVNRIAEERMLNDKGRKIVRQKRGQDVQQTNHYYNIDEEDAQQFDQNWRKVDQNTNFVQSHQKHLQNIGNGNNYARQLQYNPSAFEQRQPRNNQPKITNNYSRRK